MPAYGNPGGGGGADLYTDAGPTDAEAPATETETSTQEEDAGNEPTAELPKAVLGGKDFKPGEEVVLEVVQVMENSVLVKYASEEGGGEQYPSGEGESEAPAGGGDMSGMME